jgi:hypothetical protein
MKCWLDSSREACRWFWCRSLGFFRSRSTSLCTLACSSRSRQQRVLQRSWALAWLKGHQHWYPGQQGCAVIRHSSIHDH